MKLYVTMMLGMIMAASGLTLYAQEKPAAMTATEKAAMTQSIYVCPDCHTMAMKAGKCEKCGKEMMPSHVLGVKDGEAMVCGCSAGCNCDAKGMKDGKCACGKDVSKVSLKGMCVCPAGCPTISDKAGKCPGCGKEMKKVE